MESEGPATGRSGNKVLGNKVLIANPSFSIHPLDGQHASQAGTSAQKTGEKAKSHTPWELE